MPVVVAPAGTAPVTAQTVTVVYNLYATDGYYELPDGMFYTQAFQGYSGNRLARFFVNNVAGFERAAVDVGGTRVEGGEAILVHLCPTAFLKQADLGIKPGDRVDIRGCWAEINGKDVLMASKIKKGEKFELKLRLTKDGTPFWTMTPEQLAKEQKNQNN